MNKSIDILEPTCVARQAAPAAGFVGDLARVVEQIGARELWSRGITGRGVTVAVVDTGFAPVPALTTSGKVKAAVDLSEHMTDPDRRLRDLHGHGTHMAGIIAGQDSKGFRGVAPDASLVSVKVGGTGDTADSDRVAAGIDWAVLNSARYGIRVISLSAGEQALGRGPVTAAVERAWRAGVVVVACAGNRGAGSNGLDDPATSRSVIAVGGATCEDGSWRALDMASSSDGTRNPDVAAPGRSIVSLRAPGSTADLEHPEGYVDDRLFKGTGSSQATAVVAGAVALLLQARPELTPAQVGALLRTTASPLGDEARLGHGLIDLAAAAVAPIPSDVSEGQAFGGLAAPCRLLPTPRVVDSTTWDIAAWNSTTWGSTTWGSTTWGALAWNSTTWGSTTWGSTTWGSTTWGAGLWS